MTRERFGFRDSTIDHAWVGAGLQYEYWGREEEVQGSDHYAQVVTVKDPGLRQQERTVPMGWSWSKMDRKRVEDDAVHIRPVGPLQSPEDLDEAIAQLSQAVEIFPNYSHAQYNAIDILSNYSHAQYNLAVALAERRVLGVAFAPDGRTAVTCGGDAAVRLWGLPSPAASKLD